MRQNDVKRLELPPEQEAIRAKCYHPTGLFEEFKREEVEQSIPARFEKIVDRHPRQIAVKHRHASLTYQELNRAANHIAQQILVKRGSDSEPIALLLDHGLPMICGILGALKAGKFYMPLDSSHPHAAHMVADSEACLIVTNEENLATAKALSQSQCQLINIDRLDSGKDTETPSIAIDPAAYAYVLYTSGSTGKPKGVIQRHRSLLHRIMIHTNNLHLCVHDRLTLLHSCVFTPSVDNLFGALLNGGSLFRMTSNEKA